MAERSAANTTYYAVVTPGSIVIERYKPDKGRIQWLSQVVDRKGDLRLRAVCKTRHEALVEADRG